jgi:secondary thiamine-phosphate synthase enzyme
MKRDAGAVLEAAVPGGREPSTFIHRLIRISTTAPNGYVDLTDELSRLVARTRVACGLLHLQTRHTTTGLLINECEPLLLMDIDERLERWAPADAFYGHDDESKRTVNLVPGERRNGHAHCRAMLFRVSETVQIVDGRLALGRWQRVLFVELDGPQEREVSVMIQI